MRSPFSSRLALGAALCGLLMFPVRSRADAFSPIAQGDPIYRQLGSLTLLGEGKTPKPAAGLTRYEAALQVARVSAIAASKPQALSRSGWRALRDLTNGLKSELGQLGVDVEDVLATCARQLDAPAKSGAALPSSSNSKTRGASSAPAGSSFLNGQTSPSEKGFSQSELQVPLSGSVSIGAGVSSLQDGPNSPAGRSSVLRRTNPASQFVGSDASVALDLNSWLRVRALTSQRRLGLGDEAPVLSSPLFQGASKATGVGGTVEVSPLNGLRLSTDVEQLSTNVGISGLRVGGGIGLSAWQNRLTLSARMSRLQSGDRTILPSTATELGIGIGVSQRLSLNLLYQSLFSSQSESSRLAGGLNFSF
jgi:hypothetical protein